ncbi:hypothetical protein [Kineococcus sp. NPDC059986]|uniref:hypothetical protein n=1 Tax=Kineococcus sp. NPDC059986 TaxID=3155538 RepID=UPI00344B839D
MTRRATTLTLSLALAASVALPTAGSAFASRPGGPEPTSTSTATATPTATGTPTARPTERPAPRPTVTRAVRAPKLVVAGTLAAVDPAANRITVTVHGGREKALRDQDVVVALTPTTVLRQDGAVVTAAALRPGGHVNAQVTRAADGSFTATRVTVEREDDRPTSSPTSSATSSPTSSATSSPTATRS